MAYTKHYRSACTEFYRSACPEPSRRIKLNSMPSLTPKRYFSILFQVSSFLFLVLFLSGCKAIGTTKPAALQITSVPEASVFLDGKHLGKTPFFSDQLKVGEY